MTITSSLFEAYLKCATKCWLRAIDEPPIGNTYAQWVRCQNESFRTSQTERLLTQTPKEEVSLSPPLQDLKAAQWRLALDVTVQTSELSPPHGSQRHEAQTANSKTRSRVAEFRQRLVTSVATDPASAYQPAFAAEARLHAIERVTADGRDKAAQFIPIRFIFTNKLSHDDKLLLAFDVFVLSGSLGREIAVGKIIHGDDYAEMKVKTPALVGEVRKRIEKIIELLSCSTPPDLVLNRHCTECEFHARCRQKALEKDDLSLLPSVSEYMRQYLAIN